MNEVEDALARFLLALDDHDWETVTASLAGTVRRDYSSLTGAAPDELAGSALAGEWRDALTRLDSHQHLLGLPAVDLGDDGARVSVPVVATHVLEGDPGSPWTVGGTYRMGLRRSAGRWRITELTLEVRWQSGAPDLLARAAARG